MIDNKYYCENGKSTQQQTQQRCLPKQTLESISLKIWKSSFCFPDLYAQQTGGQRSVQIGDNPEESGRRSIQGA